MEAQKIQKVKPWKSIVNPGFFSATKILSFLFTQSSLGEVPGANRCPIAISSVKGAEWVLILSQTLCGCTSCTLCFSLHGQDMHPGSHFEINKSYVKWQSRMYIQFTSIHNNFDFEINKSYVKWQSRMYIQLTTYLNID